jgi:HEAT repeat protein
MLRYLTACLLLVSVFAFAGAEIDVQPVNRLLADPVNPAKQREGLKIVADHVTATWQWLPTVAHLLEDPDRTVRLQAAKVLEDYGPSAHRMLSVSLPAFKKERDVEVRVQIGRAIAATGGLGGTAVPVLIEALKDPEKKIQIVAIYALGRLGYTQGADGPIGKPALAALEPLAKSDDKEIAEEAALSIRHILAKH